MEKKSFEATAKDTAEANLETLFNNVKLVLNNAITETQCFFSNETLMLDNCVPLLVNIPPAARK
jgi:hypothetical protein